MRRSKIVEESRDEGVSGTTELQDRDGLAVLVGEFIQERASRREGIRLR